MNIDKYIKNLHNSWKKLSKLPILSPIQINELNSNNALSCECKLSDEIIKMYLYCFYNYPEFYTYDISKLNQPINEHNDNLYLIAAYKGHIDIMEYLESKGFDINIKNNDGKNAYLMAAICVWFRFFNLVTRIKH
jgi:hypothetical protein